MLITVTPVNGTPQSTFVQDGANGQNGSTPTVTITEGQNGTRTLTVHNPGEPDTSTVIRDGAQGRQGERGEKGEAGRDGVTPTVTVKDNKADGTHTITINDGKGHITNTIVKDGFNGKTPLVATNRNEAAKTTTVIFYYDTNGNNELDASDNKLKEFVIADGAQGEKGDKGATPKVTTARGADGRSTDITFTVPGEEPVVANIKMERWTYTNY